MCLILSERGGSSKATAEQSTEERVSKGWAPCAQRADANYGPHTFWKAVSARCRETHGRPGSLWQKLCACTNCHCSSLWRGEGGPTARPSMIPLTL